MNGATHKQDRRFRWLSLGFVVLCHTVLALQMTSGKVQTAVEVDFKPIEVRFVQGPIERGAPLQMPAHAAKEPELFSATVIPEPEMEMARPHAHPTHAEVSATTISLASLPAQAAKIAPQNADPAAEPLSIGRICPGHEAVLQDAGFPLEAAHAYIESGVVLVSLTVDLNGAVKNPLIVQSSNRVFNRHSLETVMQFKCHPQIRAVEGVLVPLAFQME